MERMRRHGMGVALQGRQIHHSSPLGKYAYMVDSILGRERAGRACSHSRIIKVLRSPSITLRYFIASLSWTCGRCSGAEGFLALAAVFDAWMDENGVSNGQMCTQTSRSRR